jgi:hypothetical protein
MDLVRPLNFLTLKPILVVINAGEDRLDEPIPLKIRRGPAGHPALRRHRKRIGPA